MQDEEGTNQQPKKAVGMQSEWKVWTKRGPDLGKGIQSEVQENEDVTRS